MNTRNNAVSEFLSAKQDSRRKKVQRRKRLKAGLPAAVALKPLSLDQEQKSAISALQTVAETPKGNRILTPRHFAWLVSLSLHLIAAFVVTLHIVPEPGPDDEPLAIKFMDPIPEPRRLLPRKVESVTPTKRLTIQPKQLQQRTAATVEIPSEEARFEIPTDNLFGPTDALTDSGVSIEGLDRVEVENYRAKIPTTTPGVKIERTPSLIAETDELDTAPDPELKEREIQAEATEVDQNPRFIKKVKPKYPEAARRAQKVGVVKLEATIGVDGRARDIKVVESLGFGCDEAAVEALERSRFVPAKRGKDAIPRRIRIPFRFTLER